MKTSAARDWRLLLCNLLWQRRRSQTELLVPLAEENNSSSLQVAMKAKFAGSDQALEHLVSGFIS